MLNRPSTDNLDFFTDEFRFRDMEFDELLTSFRQVLNYPGEAIARVILIGPAGSGKTFLLQNFQERIINCNINHPSKGYSLNCITIDCSKHDSSKSVVFEIIKKIDPYFKANLEECYTAELQFILADILSERKEALVIIFDNIDSLVELEPEEVNSLIYGFQRFSEGKVDDSPNMFSQILVAHDLAFIQGLDRSVFRKVVTDVIPFEPYTAEQTFLLLKDHVKKAIRRKLSEETIWFVAMISQGNMRLAIELLEGANTLAAQNHQIQIVPEHIRVINEKLTEFRVSERVIEELTNNEKLFLLMLARKFQLNSRAFINYLDLPSMFFGICEEFDVLHEAKYFSEILGTLEKKMLIGIHTVEKDIIVTLSDISATKLADHLSKGFKIKRRDKPYFT